MKIKSAGTDRLTFHCPGCDERHVVDRGWTYNGNAEKPTLTPSVLVTSNAPGVVSCCHFHVEEGRIRYLADSAHALAGQTVDMVDL